MDVELLHRLAVALHAHAIGGEFADIDTGLEVATFAGVHDHADGRILIELGPCLGELVSHGVVHRIAHVGSVVDQPADRPVSLDDQVLVAHRGVSFQATPW